MSDQEPVIDKPIICEDWATCPNFRNFWFKEEPNPFCMHQQQTKSSQIPFSLPFFICKGQTGWPVRKKYHVCEHTGRRLLTIRDL